MNASFVNPVRASFATLKNILNSMKNIINKEIVKISNRNTTVKTKSLDFKRSLQMQSFTYFPWYVFLPKPTEIRRFNLVSRKYLKLMQIEN